MKKEKQSRTRLKLFIIVALAAVALSPSSMRKTSAQQDSGSPAHEPVVIRAQSDGCADLTGKWKISTEHGSAVWELKKLRTKDIYKPRQVIPSSDRQYLPGDQYLAGDGYVAGDGQMAGLLDDNTLKLEYDGQKQDTRESYIGIYLCKLDAKCQSSISPCVLHHGQEGRGRPDATFKATIKRQ